MSSCSRACPVNASIDHPPTIHHGRSKPAMKLGHPAGSSGAHAPYHRKNSSSSATSSGVRCRGSR